MSNTKSATLPISIMALRSLLHSMKVRRRVLPLTQVTGPRMSFRLCLVKRLMSDFISVVLPTWISASARIDQLTPGGPTTATMTGGGGSVPSFIPLPFSVVTLRSSGLRLTRGTWSLRWSFSAALLACKLALRNEVEVKAWIVRFTRRHQTTDLVVEALSA